MKLQMVTMLMMAEENQLACVERYLLLKNISILSCYFFLMIICLKFKKKNRKLNSRDMEEKTLVMMTMKRRLRKTLKKMRKKTKMKKKVKEENGNAVQRGGHRRHTFLYLKIVPIFTALFQELKSAESGKQEWLVRVTESNGLPWLAFMEVRKHRRTVEFYLSNFRFSKVLRVPTLSLFLAGTRMMLILAIALHTRVKVDEN